uniref:Uncharacterized protein n=1 Tax=Ananas comosus var. bracteatus TaxID=296719 RepID=A0A6V7NVZ4_ANACO|nr:unnamed protein product [Ananas comosus var. bracteatus]
MKEMNKTVQIFRSKMRMVQTRVRGLNSGYEIESAQQEKDVNKNSVRAQKTASDDKTNGIEEDLEGDAPKSNNSKLEGTNEQSPPLPQLLSAIGESFKKKSMFLMLMLWPIFGSILIVIGLYFVLWGKSEEKKATSQVVDQDLTRHPLLNQESSHKDNEAAAATDIA